MPRYDDEGDADLDYSVAITRVGPSARDNKIDNEITGWAEEEVEVGLATASSSTRREQGGGRSSGGRASRSARPSTGSNRYTSSSARPTSQSRHQPARATDEDSTVDGEFVKYAIRDDGTLFEGDEDQYEDKDEENPPLPALAPIKERPPGTTPKKAAKSTHKSSSTPTNSKSSKSGKSKLGGSGGGKKPDGKSSGKSDSDDAKKSHKRARSAATGVTGHSKRTEKASNATRTPATTPPSTPPREEAAAAAAKTSSWKPSWQAPSERRKSNRVRLLAAVMMVLGLLAVVLGVVFGFGLVDVGGKNSSESGAQISQSDGADLSGWGGGAAADEDPTTSPSPTAGPTGAPVTDRPTVPPGQPTADPTLRPTTLEPTEFPTATPTSKPTPAPTAAPTISFEPTENMWATETEPANPPSSYFNYNPKSWLGPDNWGANVDDTAETEYWKQFEEWISPNLDRNRCDDDRQSPIDVRFDWAKGQCFEYHEIRHEPGEFSVMNPKVEAQILPSKLRVVYPQVFDEDCNAEPWTKQEFDEEVQKVVCKDDIKGPSADIPKGWGYQLPVLHVDIKIPSEHYLEGKQYAAEYQINLIQNKSAKRGAPVVSVLLDLHPENVPNKALQVVLDRFQMEYDADLAKCEANRRKQRRLEAALMAEGGEDRDTWLDEPEEEEVKFQSYLRKTQRDLQQTYTYFDPWSSEIKRSIWFYGYEGSLTEPPCTEFVEWRIIDTPGLISVEQLHQMKKLLFHHVDRDCKRTSVHHEGSVARPLQPYNGRLVHRCMCRDFIADRDRKRYGSGKCTWRDRGDIFGFDENLYTEQWYDEHHRFENGDHQNCVLFNEDCDEWAEELAQIEAEKAAAEAAAAAEAEAAVAAAAEAATAAAEGPGDEGPGDTDSGASVAVAPSPSSGAGDPDAPATTPAPIPVPVTPAPVTPNPTVSSTPAPIPVPVTLAPVTPAPVTPSPTIGSTPAPIPVPAPDPTPDPTPAEIPWWEDP